MVVNVIMIKDDEVISAGGSEDKQEVVMDKDSL